MTAFLTGLLLAIWCSWLLRWLILQQSLMLWIALLIFLVCIYEYTYDLSDTKIKFLAKILEQYAIVISLWVVFYCVASFLWWSLWWSSLVMSVVICCTNLWYNSTLFIHQKIPFGSWYFSLSQFGLFIVIALVYYCMNFVLMQDLSQLYFVVASVSLWAYLCVISLGWITYKKIIHDYILLFLVCFFVLASLRYGFTSYTSSDNTSSWAWESQSCNFQYPLYFYSPELENSYRDLCTKLDQ